MSLNEEKDGEDPNNLAIPQNVQDELAHVIHMSLNNIATQVDNLNKRAESLLSELSKEVDAISCKYDTLEKRAIQLNNGFTVKEIKDLFLQATKLKSSQSASIQTELDYLSNLLPAKIYESHDASVQTSFYMSTLHGQDGPQFLVDHNCQEETESLITPYNQDGLMIQCCQNNEQDLTDPYCSDSDEDLAVSPKVSYYFETCEEKFSSGIKEQVHERFRRKNQHVGHPIESKNGPQNTLMGNDIIMGHTPPASIERSHSHVDPPEECSGFSTYPINQISKALTQAVGKVLASPPRSQKKEVRFQTDKESYVRYGVEKNEIKLPVQIQNYPKLEVLVSPAAPAPRTALASDCLAMSSDSKVEYPASKIHSQTQFPSPVLRTSSATHHHNYFQSSLEVGIQTTENKEDYFSLSPSPPEYYDLLKQDQGKGERTPMSTSPVLLRRIEAKEKCSDLLVHASFAQSQESLVYPPSRPLFPQSPRFSASKSPKPSALLAPRSSCHPPTKYVGSAWSTASNGGIPRHSNLETCQNSVPLAESFSRASRSSMSAAARCSTAYSGNHPVSPSRLAAQPSRISVPSSGKAYIEQSTNNPVLASQQSSNVKPSKSMTLQSLFSFPQSASSSAPSPHTLSMYQYSEDTVNSNCNGSPALDKGRSSLRDSVRQGVLLHQTEEHCILKAQIEFSKQ